VDSTAGQTIGVIGENLVDILVHRDHSVDGVPGGGPFNVARAVARLGQNSLFISGISGDAFGKILRDALVSDGVDLALTEPVPLPSTLAIVDLTGDSPDYFFHLNSTAAFATEVEPMQKLLSEKSDSLAALYFGTLGLSVEPMASTGESLIASAPSETIVVLDPNCRPSAIDDRDSYCARLFRLFPRTDLVKVSTEDLDYLALAPTYEEAAQKILEAGAGCVVVTDGPGLVKLVFDSEVLTLEVPRVEAVDTVGAGDSLVGGFLAWWTLQGYGRAEFSDHRLVALGIEAGIAIAGITCTRKGADTPRREEVRHLDSWKWLA